MFEVKPQSLQYDDEVVHDSAGLEFYTRHQWLTIVIVLQGLGLNLKHVLSCRVYLTKFERDYETMNKVYQSYFSLGRLPARTCVGVTALARDALVEVDMVAKRPSG